MIAIGLNKFGCFNPFSPFFLLLETCDSMVVKNVMSSTREWVALYLWYYVIYLYRVMDFGSWWFWTVLTSPGKFLSNVFGNDDWCRWWLSCLLDCCYVFGPCWLHWGSFYPYTLSLRRRGNCGCYLGWLLVISDLSAFRIDRGR